MDVHLLVYDLSRGMAKSMSLQLLGFQLDAVYHTSIKLRGREYVYDGNVVAIPPGSSHLGQPMQEIYLGTTHLPQEVIEEYLDSLREIYTVEAYDLFRHNCNNFSNDFSTFLVGKGIPSHIRNMPQAVLDSPFGQMMMPMLNQQVGAQKRQGGILGIQQTTPGSSSKPQAEFHHHFGNVQYVKNLQQLDQLLAKARSSCAVIFFTSATCPPCKLVYPLYDELAAEAGDKGILIKVDTSEAFDVASRYSISATPTFMTFLKGEQENRWSGADPSALQGNVRLLLQMAWPLHPHQSLSLPTFARLGKPVLFSKVPPLPKLLAKMGPVAEHAAVQGVKEFIEARSVEGPAETTLPDMVGFTAWVRESMEKLPVDISFTVVDLLRCALVDPRFSGYLAEEKDQQTVLAVLESVNSRTDCPYALRLVTLQMACNLFSSHLYEDQVLGHAGLRTAVTQLISSSFLDDGHSNVRVAAASLLFNMSLANSRKRRDGPGDVLPEDDQVELAASTLEAIGQEETSTEALEGMVTALGLLVYRLPLDSQLADLLRTMDAEDTIKSKQKKFPDLRVIKERYAARSHASTPSLRSRDGTVPPHARMDPGGNVRVVVRVRAFLPREINRNATCLIKMDPITQQTTLMVPDATDRASNSRRIIEEKQFTFDNSFWSHNPSDEHYATQEDVYDSLGEEFLDHNFEGYHTCIFAYGQTGSGKSYTMMGTPDAPGLIPRTCEDLFERIAAAQDETPNISYNVRVSYFEVYNEHVRDLLVPVVPSQPPYYLKIRESPTEGPYVKDLTEVPVRNINEILRYMRVGDASRTTASTKMNDTSSRSHAVFTIMLKQIHHDLETDETTERSSRIRLVDLAGSERAKSTEATGARLREGSNINKSLTTLGRVIAALADPKKPAAATSGGSKPNNKKINTVVPYRDSILTWLLKDSLGGNSKTAMIACIAPSDYEETLSTLRYADQAKRIRTRAVVNQDSISTAERDAQIAAMAEEIRTLQLVVGDSQRREKNAREAEEKLDEYQARVRGLQRLMEERSLAAESKIRSLQTENEALRLHLKLALESLRNPITVPHVEEGTKIDDGLGGLKKRVSSLTSNSRDEDKENEVDDDDDDNGYLSEASSGGETVVEGGREGTPRGGYEEDQDDMHETMQGLLKDLNMFRRKIGDDKTRFVDELLSGAAGRGKENRVPLGVVRGGKLNNML
ncbi:P-loop containing nucleoside triphosphate hydrolase protein [Rhypophila decipiens]